MPIDPRAPVIVGAAQLNGREGKNEPIAMMREVSFAANVDTGGSLLDNVQQVRVLKGIWPYVDPGSLLAAELGLSDVMTTLNPVGGNEVFDLLSATADEIQQGQLDAALICSAETMRTRRADKKNGINSTYLPEPDSRAPDQIFGDARPLADEIDWHAGAAHAVNFYAMVESSLRHASGTSIEEHRMHISELWADASRVATANQFAWLRDERTAEDIAAPSADNRMVASPYAKLMTSNINVDQAAAVIVCSYEHATKHRVSRDRMVFIQSGAGGYDTWVTRNRFMLHASPAMRLAGEAALRLAGADIDDLAHIDLYSCFPSSVQVCQQELGLNSARPFTITGGLTFAGGPFNSYCMHSLATAVGLLRDGDELALLNGNGGFFTKHSFSILGSKPPAAGFRSERPQKMIDALPSRPPTHEVPAVGSIEAYTVLHDRDGRPERAVLSILDSFGSRTWANSSEPDLMTLLLTTDAVSTSVLVADGTPPTAALP